MIKCHSNQPIRVHLQWVSGKTNSNKNIIISFLGENEDLIDIGSNNDFDIINGSNKSTSSKLSDGGDSRNRYRLNNWSHWYYCSYSLLL